MILTKDTLVKIFPNAVETSLGIDAVVAALNNAFSKLGDGPRRVPMFIAQTGEESNEYRSFTENLNYSWEALMHVFPSHFSSQDDAMNYHRQPEKIANRIYANRLGNGDEASGDGWKYRGRGFIQITGMNNYEICGDSLGIDLVSNPDYLCSLPGAVDSAVWYWNIRDINKWADIDDVRECTHLINGGLMGLNFRQSSYDLSKQLLRVS